MEATMILCSDPAVAAEIERRYSDTVQRVPASPYYTLPSLPAPLEAQIRMSLAQARLSPQEIRVVLFDLMGADRQTVAKILMVEPHSITRYRQRIMEKLRFRHWHQVRGHVMAQVCSAPDLQNR